jgi:hypothetical protein
MLGCDSVRGLAKRIKQVGKVLLFFDIRRNMYRDEVVLNSTCDVHGKTSWMVHSRGPLRRI